MMKSLVTVASGMGVLIAIYLFIKNGDSTAKIIGQASKSTVAVVNSLQN